MFAELPGGAMKPEQAADLAQGVRLRAYAFDRYKTKRKDDEKPPANAQRHGRGGRRRRRAQGLRRARGGRRRRADGARPGQRAGQRALPGRIRPPPLALKKVGVAVEVLDVKAMKKLGMNALLGVGQGSARESRVVVMRWNGGKKGDAPVAFIGKGVCFDTGGISIKPAAGMEDMKGDMAGAACVVGLMHALAARKAQVNAVGVIGMVENMPDGNAQRPGDIVKSMSGQTIEIINTDAEGRLVLADVIWYAAKRFKPKFMVDLATLTGAIIVALGQEYAGMFSNDDKLAERLTKAGEATGELVWRMPLGAGIRQDDRFQIRRHEEHRRQRWGGAITAAQFIQRFVADKTPWAHLDIAGTGFDSPPDRHQQELGLGLGRAAARSAGGGLLREVQVEEFAMGTRT